MYIYQCSNRNNNSKGRVPISLYFTIGVVKLVGVLLNIFKIEEGLAVLMHIPLSIRALTFIS